MKTKAAPAIAIALGLIAALAGCESPVSDDAACIDRESLLAGYNSFDTADEMPAFGDAILASTYADSGGYGDEMENHREVRNAYRNGAAQYMLRLVWGNIERPDTADGATASDCPVTDWSGSLEVAGGVATVKYLIRFEPPEDHIVRPRPGPRQVAWSSYTMNGFDGIVFKVIDVPDPAGSQAANSLTITTPFHTVEIAFGDLADYSALIEIDDCNKLSIVSVAAEQGGCTSGFLEGGWVAETDTSGYFRGGWMSGDGRVAGYVHGTYAVRDGARVLYGKWITLSGNFGGLIKGTWRPVETERGPDGIFEARWVDDLFILRGGTKGHYHTGPEGGAGFFHGRWREMCR
jgi:hypothetical protein